MTTIHVEKWRSGGSQQWSKLGVRRLLKIRHRATINEHCSWLGYNEPLTTEQLRDIYQLRRFLGMGRGSMYSHARYFQLQSAGLLDQYFQGIDINHEFEELITNESQTT
jgi:hypothetical protein